MHPGALGLHDPVKAGGSPLAALPAGGSCQQVAHCQQVAPAHPPAAAGHVEDCLDQARGVWHAWMAVQHRDGGCVAAEVRGWWRSGCQSARPGCPGRSSTCSLPAGLGGRFSGVPLQRCNGRSEELDGVGGAGAATLVVAGFAWRATPQQQLEVCDSVSAMADGRGAIVSYSVIVCFFAC